MLTTLLISSFLVTLFRPENSGREFLSLLTWQLASAVLAFGLLAIAKVRSGEDLTGLVSERKTPETLPILLLVAVSAVIVVNSVVPYMATTCSDIRCVTFEQVFGSLSGGFQPFYMLNFFCGLLLLSGGLHVARVLLKKTEVDRRRRTDDESEARITRKTKMKPKDDEIGHVTLADVNIFKDLGFDPQEAASLQAESDAQIDGMIEIKENLETVLRG
ncbi:hypothetical protein [Rhizobium sp. LjRoot258]|uniref:hypothetical protein n=1 Tax=Rhizobium sp. LjRoot258 TaxID=3342299 RepID=UPI003ED0DE56